MQPGRYVYPDRLPDTEHKAAPNASFGTVTNNNKSLYIITCTGRLYLNTTTLAINHQMYTANKTIILFPREKCSTPEARLKAERLNKKFKCEF